MSAKIKHRIHMFSRDVIINFLLSIWQQQIDEAQCLNQKTLIKQATNQLKHLIHLKSKTPVIQMYWLVQGLYTSITLIRLQSCFIYQSTVTSNVLCQIFFLMHFKDKRTSDCGIYLTYLKTNSNQFRTQNELEHMDKNNIIGTAVEPFQQKIIRIGTKNQACKLWKRCCIQKKKKKAFLNYQQQK